MTGEMHQSEVTRESFPLHFAVADAVGGEVRAFDQYQGPYIAVPGKGRLWLMTEDGTFGVIYSQSLDEASGEFLLHGPDSVSEAVHAARSLLGGDNGDTTP